ncbi:MAG: hypothetical protein OQK55_04695, partial [Thermoanaerobaculales bacterium]|nr:hypothetical protein [Thermoanaerobaculales bacterium]
MAIALSSSLVVALVANPLILGRFMQRTTRDGRIVQPEEDLRWLKRFYVWGVSWALNHRWQVVVLIFISLAAVAAMLGLKLVKV